MRQVQHGVYGFGASFAFLAAASKVLLLLALGSGALGSRYFGLLNWDSLHYQKIATDGYTLSVPVDQVQSVDIHEGRANFVFFPGYPLLGGGLSKALGISVEAGLLIGAHFCAFLFWLGLGWLLTSWKVSRRRSVFLGLLIWCHPAAFYLGVGYTEPLFLCGLLGFLVALESEKTAFKMGLGMVSGLTMGITRIVAWALIPCTFLSSKRRDFWGWVQASILSMSLVAGTFGFFAYGYSKFGIWNLYFKLEEVGWGNHRRWFALLDPLSYHPRFFFEHSVDSINRMAVPLTAVLLLWVGQGLYRMAPGASRVKLWTGWLAAFALFYIPLTGKAAANMDSMIRYTLPSFIVLGLLGAREDVLLKPVPQWVIRGVAMVGLGIQVWFAWRFVHGKWVA